MQHARLFLSVLIGLGLAACSAAPPEASAPAPAASAPATPAPTRSADVPGSTPAPAPVPDSSSASIKPSLPSPAPAPPQPALQVRCSGALKQGGLAVCRGAPGTRITLGTVSQPLDANGFAFFGLPVDAPAYMNWSAADGGAGTLAIAPRKDEFSEVPGFDCDKVEASTPEQKAHAARSWELKQAAWTNFNPGRGAQDGFIKPSASPPSSPFGKTRKYVGVSKTSGQPCEKTNVHYGYDMAAPAGTPVVAPAAGTVILADPDLYYEGGAVFLDHGHGLVSLFMHLSRVDVKAGDVVDAGAPLALSGNTGRTTGPHLHWAVKWRNPASTDRSGDFYIDPALLLDLPPTE